MENDLRSLLLVTLRNQEVMINALAALLTGERQDQQKEQQRDNILADLATCAGLTHYLVEDLSNQDDLRS